MNDKIPVPWYINLIAGVLSFAVFCLVFFGLQDLLHYLFP